jgi:alpha-beta hydrolase superfamily lysophospholipase
MGLPGDAVTGALRSVRSVAGWPVAWTATAQRFLSETRRPETAASADRDPHLARARQRAAFCYHAAHWLAYEDPRAIRTMRSAAVALFGRSAPVLLPDLTPVVVHWRARALPGYLRLPTAATAPLPLVVLLNGVTTSKEELCLWADAFLARGQAVLALDQPGTGEAAELGRPSVDHVDLSDALVAFAELRPELDERRIALVGISLGGAQAVLAAAQDRRIAATVAVTPPFEPARWFDYVNPIIWEQAAGFAGGGPALMLLAEEFGLAEVVRGVSAPLLVVGAGRDLVVPPAEAIGLAAAAGELGTLLWYGEGGHCLYEAMPWWTADAAAWLDAVLSPAPAAVASESTRVDDRPVLAATSAPPAAATTGVVGDRPGIANRLEADEAEPHGKDPSVA